MRLARTIEPGEVDFLEIRADAFAHDPSKLLQTVTRLRVPLILTVRHPAEGGENALPAQRRRALFLELLPYAAFVDLELRSLKTAADVSAEARARGVKIILSQHHFRSMPAPSQLRSAIRRAHAAGADICKIAARAEAPAHLAILLALFTRKWAVPLSVMGMGRLGKISRLLLAQAGSIFNYGYLDRPNASGQWEARLLKKRLTELASE